MIRSAHIRGFKSLLDVKLDLARFNVFVGPGGAGKTNLLEAIGLAADATHPEGVKEIRLWRRGVRPGMLPGVEGQERVWGSRPG